MTPHDATRGFQAAADVYERGRPTFPEEAVECVAEECRIRASSTVVELGAGTGKFTRQLWRRAARWVAIEPVEAMRSVLEEHVPDVEAIDGTAEDIPLPDAAADVVVAAQCFHWFRGSEALADIHRVLRRDGRLGLVWNVRDEETPWVAELSELIDRYRGDTPAYSTMDWRRPFATTTLFTALNERVFPYEQGMDADQLVDRVTSISFIALLDDDEKAKLVEQVRALVADQPAFFTLPYLTHVYWCTRR